jgi:hypothetical protein
MRTADRGFADFIRGEIASNIRYLQQLGEPERPWEERERENEEIFEAAMSLRRVAASAFRATSLNLNELAAKLEDARTFKIAKRTDREAASQRLLRVAQLRPDLAERLKLTETASKLDAEARRWGKLPPHTLAQPGIELRAAAADTAITLMKMFTNAEPTKTKDGPLKTITARLVQAATGSRKMPNVERICDTVLDCHRARQT